MRRKPSVLQILILIASALLMYWAISTDSAYRMAAAVSAMVLMVASAVSFACISHDRFTRSVAVLIVLCAVLTTSAICVGSMLPEKAPAASEEEEETMPEAPLEEKEEEKAPEPPPVPSAPSVSVRNQEVSEGEPEAISGKGSASVPAAPEVFNLIWFEDESI